jgi:hypothetical protein
MTSQFKASLNTIHVVTFFVEECFIVGTAMKLLRLQITAWILKFKREG